MEQHEPSRPLETDKLPFQGGYSLHNLLIHPGQVSAQVPQSPQQVTTNMVPIARRQIETGNFGVITGPPYNSIPTGNNVEWNNTSNNTIPTNESRRGSDKQPQVSGGLPRDTNTHQEITGQHGEENPLEIVYSYGYVFQARPKSRSRRERRRKSTKGLVTPPLTPNPSRLPPTYLHTGEISSSVSGSSMNVNAQEGRVPTEQQRVLKEIRGRGVYGIQHEESNTGDQQPRTPGQSGPSLSSTSAVNSPRTFVTHVRQSRVHYNSWNSPQVTSSMSAHHNTLTSSPASSFLVPSYTSPSANSTPSTLQYSQGPFVFVPSSPRGNTPLRFLPPERVIVLLPYLPQVQMIKDKLTTLEEQIKSPIDPSRKSYAADSPQHTPRGSSVSKWLQVAEKVLDEVVHEVVLEVFRRKFNSTPPTTKTLHAFALETLDNLMRSAKWIASGAALLHKSKHSRDQNYTKLLRLESNYFPITNEMARLVVEGVTSTPAFGVWRSPKFMRHTKGILQFFIYDPRGVERAYDYLSGFSPSPSE